MASRVWIDNMGVERDARRAQLEQYLLGTLDEDARCVVQEQVSRDPGMSAELRAIEIDLLDAAVRGGLDPERQQRVEAYLAAAAHDGNAWVLAQALIERESRAGEQARDAREARRAGRSVRELEAESESGDDASRGEGRRAPPPVTRSHRVLFLIGLVVLAIIALGWSVRSCG